MKAGKRFPVADGHGHHDVPPAYVAATGEFRNPGPGEWYISGAIPEGYYTYGGFPQRHWIARPVNDSEHEAPTATDGLLLVISNHRASHDYAHTITQKHILRAPTADEVQDGTWTIEQSELFGLADNLKDWIESELDDMPLTTFRDCVRAQLARDAFDDVDWDELARHCLERVKANDTI